MSTIFYKVAIYAQKLFIRQFPFNYRLLPFETYFQQSLKALSAPACHWQTLKASYAYKISMNFQKTIDNFRQLPSIWYAELW